MDAIWFASYIFLRREVQGFNMILILWCLFLQILTSMNDLCFDLVGIQKEKKDPQSVKTNQGKGSLMNCPLIYP